MSEQERIMDHLDGRPETEFPTSATPTVFADGVSGYAPGPGVIKFFLYRIDPNMFGRGGAKANAVVQVVMPFHGFAQTAALFHHAIKQVIAAGVVSQSDFDQMINAVELVNTPPTTPPTTSNG